MTWYLFVDKDTLWIEREFGEKHLFSRITIGKKIVYPSGKTISQVKCYINKEIYVGRMDT